MQACKHHLGSVQGRHHFSCTLFPLSSFFLIFGLCSTSRQPNHFLGTSPISHAHPSPTHRAPTRRPRGSESLYDYDDARLGSPRYNDDACTLPPPDEVHARPEPLCDDDHTVTVPSRHHDHAATGPPRDDDYACPEPPVRRRPHGNIPPSSSLTC